MFTSRGACTCIATWAAGQSENWYTRVAVAASFSCNFGCFRAGERGNELVGFAGSWCMLLSELP
jgi:hypothetical protein